VILQTLASIDYGAILRAAALALAASLVLAHLQSPLRSVVWTLFNVVAWPVAYAARALLQGGSFLSRVIDQSLDGLAQEGAGRGEHAATWVGWYIVGPLVYVALFSVFVFSDFSIAFLVFQAFGLVGADQGSPLPAALPLDFAIGLLFVALGAFWGLLFFDLRDATPFSYIWSRVDAAVTRWLAIASAAGFVVNLLAAFLMGVWRQWQLSPRQPDPWNAWIPPFVSGIIVLLVIAATALAGKPLGSGLVAAWVLLVLAGRAAAYVLCIGLRLLVTAIRQLLRVPLALVSLLAHGGRTIWNWLCSFEPLRRRLHLTVLGDCPVLDQAGGDLDEPVLPARPSVLRQLAIETDGALAPVHVPAAGGRGARVDARELDAGERLDGQQRRRGLVGLPPYAVNGVAELQQPRRNPGAAAEMAGGG
jgi:hypothetical protein